MLRIRKVYEAGKIFEEAGILESYDHDEVLQLLREHAKEAFK